MTHIDTRICSEYSERIIRDAFPEEVAEFEAKEKARLAAATLASDLAESAEWSECTVEEYKARCMRDVATFQATGELPAAWTPDEAPAIDDAQLDEAMREREAIESGSVEPPRFGWIRSIGAHSCRDPRRCTACLNGMPRRS
jgi:hypothetical protein